MMRCHTKKIKISTQYWTWLGLGLAGIIIAGIALAFPLLSGPGALTVVLISFGASGGLVTLISIIAVSVITYITLLIADPINRLWGKKGSLIITRIFAVFLAAFAIQFIINGITDIFA